MRLEESELWVFGRSVCRTEGPVHAKALRWVGTWHSGKEASLAGVECTWVRIGGYRSERSGGCQAVIMIGLYLREVKKTTGGFCAKE